MRGTDHERSRDASEVDFVRFGCEKSAVGTSLLCLNLFRLAESATDNRNSRVQPSESGSCDLTLRVIRNASSLQPGHFFRATSGLRMQWTETAQLWPRRVEFPSSFFPESFIPARIFSLRSVRDRLLEVFRRSMPVITGSALSQT